MNNYNIMVRGIVANMTTWRQRCRPSRSFRSIRGANATTRSRPRIVVHPARSIDTLPPAGPRILGAPVRRSSTTTRFTSATASSWRCSSRWASRRARRSSPMRGNAPSSRMRPVSATRWARTMLFEGDQRISGAMRSRHQLELGRAEPLRPGDRHYSQLDERLHYIYGAIYTSPISARRSPAPVGATSRRSRTRTATTSTAASRTGCTCRRTCRLRAFWSLTLYDTATRSMVQSTRAVMRRARATTS